MDAPRRILLVEDDPDVAEMLHLFFEAKGHRLLVAADGQDALKLVHQKMPHLILMDSILPDMDGFELCRQFRGMPATAHIPIIFLTRRAARDDMLEALELGADDFVAKPFDPEELLLRVQNALHRAEKNARIDLQSGLPGAFVAREYLARARHDPRLAIIEIQLNHSVPYRQRYGQVAANQVYGYLGQLVVSLLGEHEAAESFAGYISDNHLAVVYPAEAAEGLAREVARTFNRNASRFYQDTDRARGYLDIGGVRSPLMQVICRVYLGRVTGTEGSVRA
jgi:CheY-like chemotaxis protein